MFKAKIIRLRKKPGKRLLRQYRRFATKQYVCWKCQDPINPGDEYIGEVWVNTSPEAKVCFWIWQEHVTCPGRTFEEEADETHEQEERELEAEMAQRARVA